MQLTISVPDGTDLKALEEAMPEGVKLHMPDPMDRPMVELFDSGMLWLANRHAFHPRGFALALNRVDDVAVTGWRLLVAYEGEPYGFTEEQDNMRFPAAEHTLAVARARDTPRRPE